MIFYFRIYDFLFADFFIAETIHDVVIDHAGCLHVGVDDRRPKEFKTAFFEIFRQRLSLGGYNRKVFERPMFISNGRATDKTPNIFRESTEFFLDLEKTLGVVDGGFNLHPIADDAGVL